MASRALVLGGGGPVGIAWETGLLAGLAERGTTLSNADYILGTSAGSFVGAHLALGRPPAGMYAHQVSAATRFDSSERASGPAPNVIALAGVFQALAKGEKPLTELRKEAGKVSLATETMTEEQFVGAMSALNSLPETWPENAFGCTAIDALTGELVVWGNESGVALNRAVTSSCAVPGVYPAITINGRRYYDGGIGTATNSTLAQGYGRVLVVAVGGGTPAVMTDEMRRMRELGAARFEAELQLLRDSGSEVAVVRPNDAALEAFGPNLLDALRRGPAGEAGLTQGRAEADRLTAFWK
jgi:NTE family protein